MNYRAVANMVGRIMIMCAAFFALPLAVNFIYAENLWLSFAAPMAAMALLGLALVRVGKKKKDMYIGEGFLTVTLVWLAISLFGAVPFVFSGAIASPVDAFFETVSGFTTTGSTILTEVESLPRSVLFWRSFTHWIGGMGVLVFMLAITANHDTKTIYIMRAESPGPKAGKLVSKMKYTAQILYIIYIVLTLLELVFLLLGEMPFFDAATTAFSTAGTGGFGVRNANIAAYNSAYVEYVVGVFMLLFGINFGIYFMIITGKIADIFKNSELKWYLAIIFAAVAIITAVLYASEGLALSFRHAFFTVAATITTTGFVSADFDLWPTAAKMVIFFLMFIGGCASSTGGGLKVVRFMILSKLGAREVRLAANPRTVRPICADGKAVDNTIVRSITAYFIVYLMVSGVSMLFLSFDDVSVAECISGVVTCVNNVGPGFERIGAVGNFAHLSGFSKLVLCADMLMGRLELFPILALLSPAVRRV